MSSFELAIPTVFKHEGLFVDDPIDNGGATKYGISLRLLRSLGDKDGDGFLDGDLDNSGTVDIKDIKEMTEAQATSIYRAHFWTPYYYSRIEDQNIATKILDMTVNVGSVQSHKLVQRALWSYYKYECTPDDGILGKISIALINQIGSPLLYPLRSELAGFYRLLIAKTPAWKKWRNGWLRRAYS